jgi:hypothetical protein
MPSGLNVRQNLAHLGGGGWVAPLSKEFGAVQPGAGCEQWIVWPGVRAQHLLCGMGNGLPGAAT